MGFPAQVILWNLETYEVMHRLVLHKGKVQDLAFSHNERFLATLGGRDDNKLVLWDVESGQAVCGSPAANETATVVRFFNNTDDQLVTAGNYNLRVWSLDLANRKLRPTDCSLGQLKRCFNTVSIDANDEYVYCGTKSGDLLKVSLTSKLFKEAGPLGKPFSLGITATTLTKNGNVVVGSGDGTVAVLSQQSLKIMAKTTLDGGAVTSLVMNAAKDHFFVGTQQCNTYLCHVQTLQHELRSTCHSGGINGVAFPVGFSDLFATCAKTDIRVWSSKTRNELLRIRVPNLDCLAIAFARDGKSILSGWSDGKIRAFKPQSGQLLYTINDAHRDGVTALAVTADGRRIISGGQCGQVRVWVVQGTATRMAASLKEHKSCVHSIKLNADDSECVSASADGSCIVWSLERFSRNTCLFASTQFKAVVYHPDQSQLLTTGSDRKLSYWDAVDGTAIRVVDGSQTDVVNTIAITADGNAFVSGGADRIVRVWSYDEGCCHFAGLGHSGAITKAEISPDQQTIVTVGDEGAVFLWEMPLVQPFVEDDAESEFVQQPVADEHYEQPTQLQGQGQGYGQQYQQTQQGQGQQTQSYARNWQDLPC